MTNQSQNGSKHSRTYRLGQRKKGSNRSRTYRLGQRKNGSKSPSRKSNPGQKLDKGSDHKSNGVKNEHHRGIRYGTRFETTIRRGDQKININGIKNEHRLGSYLPEKPRFRPGQKMYEGSDHKSNGVKSSDFAHTQSSNNRPDLKLKKEWEFLRLNR